MAGEIIEKRELLLLKNDFSIGNPKVTINPATGYGHLTSVIFAPGDLWYDASELNDPRDAGYHTITEKELQKTEFLNSLRALDIVIRHQDIDVNSYGDEITPDGQIAHAWWDDDENAVVGEIIIKEKDALDKVVNRELWGGSLQYFSKIVRDGDKILQTNLLPQHWAMTNNPRDKNVRLNNEEPKTKERPTMDPQMMLPIGDGEEMPMNEMMGSMYNMMKNAGMPPEMMDMMTNMMNMMKGTEEAPGMMSMMEGMNCMPDMMKAMNESMGQVQEAIKSLSPEHDGGAGAGKAIMNESTRDILMNAYAMQNGLDYDEMKNAMDADGIDTTMSIYDKAMQKAKNMATPAAPEKKDDDDEGVDVTIKNEKDGAEVSKLSSTDFLDFVLG